MKEKANYFFSIRTPRFNLFSFDFSLFYVVIHAKAGIQSMDTRKPDRYMMAMVCQ